MITMSDIAQRAGVSRATVSYVLNGRRNGVRIPDDTRQQVLQIASELGYWPNELARAVVTGKNRVLGFVTGGADYEPTARLLSGAIEEAGRHNYFVKVFHLRNNELIDEIIENSIKLRLAGLVVCSLHEYVNTVPTHEKMRQELHRNGISLAVVGSNMYIYSDDKQGFHLAIEHLRNLGHQKIAFLSGAATASIAVARAKAWRAAMSQSKLKAPREYIAHGDWEIEPTERVLRTLLEKPAAQRPTALCCVTDLAAFVALRAVRRIGLRVPEDLSVVGFGGLSATGWSDPPLTTVGQPFAKMGAAAIRQLLSLAEPETANSAKSENQPQELLPPDLIVRESTAIAARP